jgi:hypothetical protein
VRPWCGEVSEGAPRHPGTEDHFAGGDGRDGTDRVLGLGALEDVAMCARAHGREHRLVVVEHGEHQYGYVWCGPADVPRGVEAVHVRHLDVHDQYVGPQRHRGPDRLGPGSLSMSSSP